MEGGILSFRTAAVMLFAMTALAVLDIVAVLIIALTWGRE